MSHTKEAYVQSDAVHCKLCSTPIRVMKKIGDNTVMAECANYKEITLVFDDNSAHETCICKTCSGRLTIEQAAFLWDCDIKQWKAEDIKHVISKKYFDTLEAKIVVSFKLSSRTG